MVTRKDTAALAGVPVEEPAAAEAPAQEETPAPEAAVEEAAAAEAPPVVVFISEGIRQDLEMHGKATDPVTGAVLELDPVTGEITIKARVPAAGAAVRLTT